MKKLIGYWRQYRLRLGVILVVVLSVGLTFIYEFEKKAWNSDEIYTMSSSVHPIWNDILVTRDAGGPILRNKEEFQRAIEFTKFDPLMVYENQVKDVHPPLFYLAFHFLALFLSKWIYQIGFLINVICMLLIDYIFIKICLLLRRKDAVILTLILLNFSVLMMYAVTLQRMYLMLTVFVALTAYLNLKIWKNGFKIEKTDALLLGLTAIAGFLTQYYYIIYAGLMLVLMLICMIEQKKIKALWQYVLIFVVAGMIGLLIYPASIDHILFGYRGVEAMASLDYSILIDGLRWVMEIAVCMVAIWLVLPVMIWRGVKSQRTLLRENFGWFLLLVSTVFYCLIVCRISPFIHYRYVIPGLAMACLPMAMTIASLKIERVWQYIGALAISIVGLMLMPHINSQTEYQEVLKFAEEHKDMKLVYLTGNDYNHLGVFQELVIYDQSLVIYKSDLDNLGNFLKDDAFILRIDYFYKDDYQEVTELLRRHNYGVKETLFDDSDVYSTHVIVKD